MTKAVFAGRLPGMDELMGQLRLVTGRAQERGCTVDFFVAHHQVDVPVTSRRWITEGSQRNYRPFDHHRFHTRIAQKIQNAEELRGHSQGKNRLQPAAREQLIQKFRRERLRSAVAKSCSKLCYDTVFFREAEERLQIADIRCVSSHA